MSNQYAPQQARPSAVTASAGDLTVTRGISENRFGTTMMGLTRIVLGVIFFWPFLDKLFGLGYATPHGKGWIDGGNPTFGFLAKGTKGPFASTYQNIAGDTWVNVLFMAGLAGIGLAFIFGVVMKVAGVCGAALALMMYAAVLPPVNNPVLDEHILYATAFLALAWMGAGNYLGLGRMWGRTQLVRRFGWLR
jgi:thiosulfate dehydrogenase [quinone] large subunit